MDRNHATTTTDEFLSRYEEGQVVISPYGLAVVSKLFGEPLRERPEREGDTEWPDGQERPNLAAARIWVNGHGEETIEIDQLVPATPEAMARWNFDRIDNYTQRTTAPVKRAHPEDEVYALADSALANLNSVQRDADIDDGQAYDRLQTAKGDLELIRRRTDPAVGRDD